MGFSCPENPSSAYNSAEDLKRAIQVLIHGRRLATQLLNLTGSTGKPSSSSSSDSGCHAGDGSSAANDLLVKILGSFTHSISILNHATSDDFSQLPPNTPLLVSSPSSWVGRKSEEDSDESSKSTTSSSLKPRRGCYKRRKTSYTWTKITPTLIDDGHAWRKYGQKVILNAKHPRNYFRCTHKFDQGCQATKQVQKTEEAEGDPPMYKITYHGHHTCRNLLIKPPHHHQIILMQQQDFSTTPTSNITDSPGVLLSFGSPNPNNKSHQQPSFFPTFPSSLMKQEHKEDIKKPCSLNHHDQSAPSDFLLSPPDPILTTTTFEPSGPLTTVLSSGSDHDHGDVISNSKIYSCTTSTHNSDHHGFDVDMYMDMVLAGPVKFDDDVLQFEFE